MKITPKLRRNMLIAGTVLAATLAMPAAAKTRTRVVDCKAGSCLLVTGQRASDSAAVRINGRAVAAQGQRNWRVSVPIDTLRNWSEPYARTITVAVAGSETQAALPIGLLGHSQDLAFLTITLK